MDWGRCVLIIYPKGTKINFVKNKKRCFVEEITQPVVLTKDMDIKLNNVFCIEIDDNYAIEVKAVKLNKKSISVYYIAEIGI